MEYLKNSYPKSVERGMDLAGKPLTAKSDRRRSSYGSLLVSVQSSEGLCSEARKCIRKDGHDGGHWPS